MGAWLLGACEFLAGKGGGTETESKVEVAGRAVTPDGQPSIGARVLLRPADYLVNPDSVAQTSKGYWETKTTGAAGRFSLGIVPAGDYRIEFIGTESGGAIQDFTLSHDSMGMQLPDAVLQPRGSITGSFAQDSGGRIDRFVQVYGLEHLVKSDSTGAFTVPNLPLGTYDIRCSSRPPFQTEVIHRNVEVRIGKETSLEEVKLEIRAKFTMTTDAQGLKIVGVDSTNPMILDNERWDHGPDHEYMWAKASMGLLDLRGNIVTSDMKSTPNSLAENMQKCSLEKHVAQLAGMTKIPPPVAGAKSVLAYPKLRMTENILVMPSPGSDLIVAEARKATPEKPLVVVVGGPLTTVAQAYLTDPSIASRMVVIGVYSFSLQSVDSLANYVVAKNCRFVQWGRTYLWGGQNDTTRLAEISSSRMGEKIRAEMMGAGNLRFGDIAPVAYLFRHGVWKTADKLKVSSDLKVQSTSDITFDFLDIPATANDWPLYTDEFYSTLADPRAYHPAMLPGRLEAEAFQAMNRLGEVVIDSTAGTEGASFLAGSWVEFKVTVTQAGSRPLSIRYWTDANANMAIGLPGKPALKEIALPAVAGWTDLPLVNVPLDIGTYTLRVSSVDGNFNLDWMEFR